MHTLHLSLEYTEILFFSIYSGTIIWKQKKKKQETNIILVDLESIFEIIFITTNTIRLSLLFVLCFFFSLLFVFSVPKTN